MSTAGESELEARGSELKARKGLSKIYAGDRSSTLDVGSSQLQAQTKMAFIQIAVNNELEQELAQKWARQNTV